MFYTCTLEDIEEIFALYDAATAYQKTKFEKTWIGFERSLVETEIKEGRCWKIVDGSVIVCVLSLTFDDECIWGKERSLQTAVYIHRIAVSPNHKGRGYTKAIINWAIEYCKIHGLDYVRMDTWGDNQELINYYISCGFQFLGTKYADQNGDLPAHYAGNISGLFEIKVVE
jgi:ribosomal protein S18 acetylase RimI-like enzyme